MSTIKNLLIMFTSVSEPSNDPFADLKTIGQKIIPSDIWSFIVQLLATAILVFILAKFLVKPAKKFIEERKAFIDNNINEAVNKNKEADVAETRLKNSRKESKDIIDAAKATAMNEKKRIMDETKQEVANMKDKAYRDIESERLKMKEDLSSEVIDVALLAASKVVNRNINDEDNHKIVSDFVNGKGDNE